MEEPGTSAPISDSRDIRLAELWSLVAANPADAVHAKELYLLVRRILREWSHFGIADASEREALINDFFVRKILEPASKGKRQQCFHSGALKTWFSRHLVSEWRKFDSRKLAPTIDHEQDGPDDYFVEISAQNRFEEEDMADSAEALIAEAHLTETEIRTSAETLLDAIETWAHLYLAEHLCPPEEEQRPVSQIALSYRIPSYHARARRLGITRKKDDTPDDYAKSILGQWLSSFTRGNFDRDHQPLYAVLLDLLCRSVFSREVPSCG